MKPSSPHTLSSRCGRRGFALLITITLLAFLVLLLVSLASITRVETQVASNSAQLAQARQHALLALNVALGRLQELAGPDQRVTATADLVANRDTTKRNWTGVWTGRWDVQPADPSFQNHLGWLVSGTTSGGTAAATTPLTAASGNQLIPLVGAGTTDINGDPLNAVSVESEPIRSALVPGLAASPAGHVIGNYAYWVGDEGVKAKVNLVDPWSEHDDTTKHIYGFIAAQRTGAERVETQSGTPASPELLATSYPVNDATLARVVSLAQFPLSQSAAADQDKLRLASRNRFHDLTVNSFSVLADVARGGLKRDLTNWLRSTPPGMDEQDGAFIFDPGSGNDAFGVPRWGLLRSYGNMANNADAPVGPLASVNESTATQHGIHPVVTFFRLGLNVSSDTPGDPFVVHAFPTLVLWNPYNVPLAAADYEVCFATDGPAQVRWRSRDSNGRLFAALHLNRATLDGVGPANQYWRFQVAPTEIPPGASLVFTLGNTAAYGSEPHVLHPAVDTGESVTFTSSQAVPTVAERTEPVHWGLWGGGILHAVLRTPPAAGAPAPTDYGVLDGALQTIQMAGYSISGTSATVPTTPSLNTAGPAIAPAMHLRVFANMANIGTVGLRWLAQQNLRAPFSLRPRINGNHHSAYSAQYQMPVGTLPFSLRAAAGDGVVSATPQDLVIAELQPAGVPLFSVAQLQHANLSLLNHYPAYAVGNSLADPGIPLDQTTGPATPPGTEGNFQQGLSANVVTLYDLSYLLNRELWDRYYFSTVPDTFVSADLAATPHHFPNARHVAYERSGSPTTAQLNGPAAFRSASAYLLLDGGFNVNSTSYHAWRALLASHNGQATDGSRTHPFSRFAKPIGTPNQVWSGYRILSDQQIDRLAHNIVTEVKRRGPFLSMGDFVNRRLLADDTRTEGFKGALQAAIDLTDTETGTQSPPRAPINDHADFMAANRLVPTSQNASVRFDQNRVQGGPVRQAPYSSRRSFAPGYLTQADLLTALGSVLTARSDTFRIRTYGEVVNPVTGVIESKAWCEAIVQRTPRYVEDNIDPWTTPAAGSINERHGRRFEVVSFRWLSPNDL